MNDTHDIPTSAAADEDGPLDPQDAARLLEQTQKKAKHQFTHQTPLLSLAQALVVLVVYGAIWFSVRGQHPYEGPSLGVVGYVYVITAVSILVILALYVQATAGVSGRTRRDERITAIPLVVALVAVYVVDGALKYDGFSNAIVYGVFDAAVPWVVVGAVMAGLAAAQEDWWKLAGALAMIVVGAASTFAGPINVWGILAVGGCLLLAGQAVLRLRRSNLS
jgi:hypothetical protein